MGKSEPLAGKKKDKVKAAQSRPVLVLVHSEPPSPSPIAEKEREVRGVRRSLGRLLRALPAANWNASAFPDAIVTRLAHCDSVTAAYLCDCELLAIEEVDRALWSLRSIESWVRDGLDAASRARVRQQELQVRILDEELTAPLVLSEWNGAFAKGKIDEGAPCELSAALSGLSLSRLLTIAQRLGSLPPGYQTMPQDLLHLALERCIVQSLLDPAMLSVLVATLPDSARRLIVDVLRERSDEGCQAQWASLYLDELPCACSAAALSLEDRKAGASTFWHPVQLLRDCGLVFLDPGCRLWIPGPLVDPLRAVLHTLGQLEASA